MSYINEYPILGVEQEREYIIKAQNGNKQAFDYLVISNMGLVVSIAKRYVGKGIELDDLTQIGTMGLMHAIKKHDTSLDVKLATYATSWIRQVLMRNIQIYSRAIRTPCHLYQKNFSLMVDIKKLEQELGYTPSEIEIIENLKITKTRYNKYIEDMKDTCSMNETATEDGAEIIDVMPSKDIDMTLNLYMKEIADTIKEVLTEREWIIFSRHVGLNGNEETYDFISKDLGVSKQRVQQIWLNVLGKLRRNSKIKMFKAS